MIHKRFPVRAIALLLIMSIVLSLGSKMKASAITELSTEEYEEIVETYSIDNSIPKYIDYKEKNEQIRPNETYKIEATDYVRYSTGEYDKSGNEVETTPEIYMDYEGMSGGSVYSEERGFIEYEVNIKTPGLYNLSILYYPIEGKSSDIERSFFVDGNLPFKEFSLIQFSRIWKNEITETRIDKNGIESKVWEKDNQGNDLKPSMRENPKWTKSYLYDSEGYITEKLSIYLSEGVHRITMVSLREPMILKELQLDNTEPTKSYETVKGEWDALGYKDSSGQKIRIEAENVTKTSSQMLYPQQDQSSPAVYPSSTKELLNNTIGGNSWRLTGQWMEWDFEVEESGYYNITAYLKQNFQKGIYVSRKIFIDNEVLFDEWNDYGFTHSQNWRLETLSKDDEPYKIYLEKGSHTLRMQVVLGDFSDIVSEVQDSMTKLNAIYRKVIRIIGVDPDTFRDYQIEASLPELEGELIEVRDQLDRAINRLKEVAGNGSDKEAVLITMRDQLNSLITDQERFTKLIKSYKINVRACGKWITQVLAQPLQLDTIYISSPDVKVTVEHDSFFAKLFYELARLFYSFIINYNQIGNVTEKSEEQKTITLWVGTGRDQANVIKSLIDETFTNKNGINVNVMLVDMSTLLQATLAGQGPDVAIQVGAMAGSNTAQISNDVPMNYGLRHAVADLSQFSDIDEVTKQFRESALTAFTFDGHIYALPETQTFPMMFYRKDILNEIGLEVPKTWDEVKVITSVLSKNQMEFGVLPNEAIYAMLLYQHGGSYYNEDATRSGLDSDEAILAFKEYCELYTDYKLDKWTSVEERFRTGECPIILADYTIFNNLQVSAPDIKGLWGMAPVPGIQKEDGTIDHSVASSGLASMIMESSEDKESAWEFLKWWNSAETQITYGKEMESLMGSAARVPMANIDAFDSLPWSYDIYEALTEQLEQVKGIPQVPGGYFSWRNVNNAFFKVTTDTKAATPREELMEKVIYINDEITYKRREFKLPLASEN